MPAQFTKLPHRIHTMHFNNNFEINVKYSFSWFSLTKHRANIINDFVRWTSKLFRDFELFRDSSPEDENKKSDLSRHAVTSRHRYDNRETAYRIKRARLINRPCVPRSTPIRVADTSIDNKLLSYSLIARRRLCLRLL